MGKTGGHFVSNLSVVELAIVLHYVYDAPEDKPVWGVGRQSYSRRTLTNCRDQMHTMRRYGGLTGFPRRNESKHNVFGVRHSSTSIGTALGMAAVDKFLDNDRRSAAIIGNGAVTAGQALEALNRTGDIDVSLLVVLNNNEMLIPPNVGALSKYLTSNVVRDIRGVSSTIKT